MQFPRGSNNRANEANRDRNNGNRMFDSQNNNRGGYNLGNMYFYEGSILNIEWTNQHGCGHPNLQCEIILQYMCDNLLRDGETTTRIPDSPDSDTMQLYGRHESYAYYRNCKQRSRNKGLFTANRNLANRNAAIYTRQNENADRYGYECAEERDYYPYWGPTPWRDIAILTDRPQRCAAYRAESQNVKSRWYCQAPQDLVEANNGNNQAFIPINQNECEALKSRILRDPITNLTLTGKWVEQPAWDIEAPECLNNFQSRPNSLSNVEGGFPYNYNWTIPASAVGERCSIRIRYNITTSDYVAWDGDTVQSSYVNANLSINTNNNRIPAKLDVWTKYGMTRAEQDGTFTTNNPDGNNLGNSRDYTFRNNPQPDIFGSLVGTNTNNNARKVRLQLAIDTDQFGRTFEDRSHRIAIRQRTGELVGKRIHNISVKGRRGNIVQTFPATEYDFHPTYAFVKNGEYVHFQWTGSNNTPAGAGQGRESTDRSNIVLLRPPVYDEGQVVTNPVTFGASGRSYPARVDNASFAFLGFDRATQIQLALANLPQMGGDMDELDDAGTYFDLGPKQVNQNGIYNYLCTRNNNFSNRDQKGRIVVSDSATEFLTVGMTGKFMPFGASGASLNVAPNVMSAAVVLSVVGHPADSVDTTFSGKPASNFIEISPLHNCNDQIQPGEACIPVVAGQSFEVQIQYDHRSLQIIKAHYSTSLTGDWSSYSAGFNDGTASLDVARGGVYVVSSELNWGAVVGIAIGCVAFLALAFGGGYWYCRNKLGAHAAATAGASKV